MSASLSSCLRGWEGSSRHTSKRKTSIVPISTHTEGYSVREEWGSALEKYCYGISTDFLPASFRNRFLSLTKGVISLSVGDAGHNSYFTILFFPSLGYVWDRSLHPLSQITSLAEEITQCTQFPTHNIRLKVRNTKQSNFWLARVTVSHWVCTSDMFFYEWCCIIILYYIIYYDRHILIQLHIILSYYNIWS